jgi:hypothetical protein
VVDFAALAAESLAANVEHGEVVMVSPQFQTNEFRAIADAIEQVVCRCPGGSQARLST